MNLPPRYTAGLTALQALQQRRLIKESREKYQKTGRVEARPTVSTKETPRSSHVIKFENKMGYKISDLAKVKKDFPDTDVEKILSKGRAAYASSGSRPNVTPEQWALARLASVLTGGNALKIDKDLVGSKSLSKIHH